MFGFFQLVVTTKTQGVTAGRGKIHLEVTFLLVGLHVSLQGQFLFLVDASGNVTASLDDKCRITNELLNLHGLIGLCY